MPSLFSPYGKEPRHQRATDQFCNRLQHGEGGEYACVVAFGYKRRREPLQGWFETFGEAAGEER